MGRRQAYRIAALGGRVNRCTVATVTTVAIDDEAIWGHHGVMKEARVSELKARLSAYLSEVRRGETVTVFDRNTPIARIVPFAAEDEQERIEEPTRSLTRLRALQPIRLRRKIDVVALLREDRDQR